MPGRGSGAGGSLSGSPSCSLKLSVEYEAAEKSFRVTLSNPPTSALSGVGEGPRPLWLLLSPGCKPQLTLPLTVACVLGTVVRRVPHT